MTGKMRALVKTRSGRGAELIKVDVPSPGPKDVVVKVESAGICGSDLLFYEWVPGAEQRLRFPRLLGHEFAGHVIEVGPAVTRFKPGDYVSADSHIVCGSCRQCLTGWQHLCNNLRILGIDVDGCFAEYALVPESSLWKTPVSISLDVATDQEPLGGAVYATLVEDVVGKSVAVIGVGPLGLFAVNVAHACGADPVIAVDLNEHRLELARKMGATKAVMAGDDVVAEVVKANNGLGVDVVLEMTGRPQAIRAAFNVLARGGRMSAVGIPERPVELDMMSAIVLRGTRVYGIHGREMFRTWAQMTGLVLSHSIDPTPAITHKFKLEEFEMAFDVVREPTAKAAKVLLVP